MAANIDLQLADELAVGVPAMDEFQRWADLALVNAGEFEVAIRIVDAEESRQLNLAYRGKDAATNVLSFPMELPDELAAFVGTAILGDLVICAPVVKQEATEQHKLLQHHWAHLVIHGMLHLQGFDHIADDEAEAMENLEITLLQQLGIDNPYGSDE